MRIARTLYKFDIYDQVDAPMQITIGHRKFWEWHVHANALTFDE